ncbi:MAG: hypothetical protein GY765_18430, partial [bacterium]|nr:hypothetical protein [bacterium]
DTIFLKNGNTINENISFFDADNSLLEFANGTQMPFSKINRIYFFKRNNQNRGKIRQRKDKRSLKRLK